MNVQTMSEINLDLEADDHVEEPCWSCQPKETVATGYIEYVDVCPCAFPNPAPLCETHYQMARKYVAMYGKELWDCPACGHTTSVVGVYRKR
jgi:hypothetical protein